jgi:hypothetical protein
MLSFEFVVLFMRYFCCLLFCDISHELPPWLYFYYVYLASHILLSGTFLILIYDRGRTCVNVNIEPESSCKFQNYIIIFKILVDSSGTELSVSQYFKSRPYWFPHIILQSKLIFSRSLHMSIRQDKIEIQTCVNPCIYL